MSNASGASAKPSSGRTSWWVSPLGGVKRKGPWEVPAKMKSVTLVGGVSLDLTEARFAEPEFVLTKFSLVGGVSVTAPYNVRVDVRGLTLLGGRDIEDVAELPADAPTVVVKAYGLLGGVTVKRA
ncbi:hypothetical protein [Yinghuangia seranimata]|uniref:hypothetical protein n=1 Tax=Yinghuangia seranimata TaxID=408067 RepID=UPI00248AD54D|nr:hypothetical protein [Yinghuangia seranimata]MDI2127309.1 hypothetical protein [Yinghuangia seranimata]